MKKEMMDNCPCGSQKTYAQCCAPYHEGEDIPTTAEALMRSRYTAFVLELKEYLLLTWHPSVRPRQLQLGSDIQWLGLKIGTHKAGQKDDIQGTVSFVARYKIQGKAHRLSEESRFIKEQGQWFYLDGDVKENV